MESSSDSCRPFLCCSMHQFDFLHPISNKRKPPPHNVFLRRYAIQRDPWRYWHNYIWKFSGVFFRMVIPLPAMYSRLSHPIHSLKEKI